MSINTITNDLTNLSKKEINSIKDLTSKLPDNANYELSTVISLDSLDNTDVQKIANKLTKDKRLSIKTATTTNDNQLAISQATSDNLNDANAVLGDIDALTDVITIRIYDCDDSQLNEITKNFDVINIRKF